MTVHTLRFPGLPVLWTALFFLGIPCSAEPLQPHRFEESLNPEVNVSGATRNGVLINALVEPESLETIFVRIPPNQDSRHLGLDLVTRDGRYRADIEFGLRGETGEFVELAYPTRFREQLLAADLPYLSVLASLKTDCKDADGTYVPVAWDFPGDVTRLQVLVNSGSNDAWIVVPVAGGDPRKFACERIVTSPTIAFNRLCTIELQPELNLMQAHIERDDFLNPLPSVPLPLAFYP